MKFALLVAGLLSSVSAFAETGKIQNVRAFTDGVQIQFGLEQYGICSDLQSDLKTAILVLATDAKNTKKTVEASIKKELQNPNGTTGECINAIL